MPDITLTLDDAPPWRRAPTDGATVRYRTPAVESAPDDTLVVHEFAEGFRLRYADATEFHIARDGRELWATWAPSSTLADTETYLLGPALGFAQRLMGVLCLHASAVVVDGVAIALCGPAQAGKSTTAGAFASAGFGVLADDMTAIRMRDGAVMALPGYDHLRVWRDTEEILLGTNGALPRLTPTWDKRALRVRAHGWTWCERAARLAAVVLLAPRSDAQSAPRVERVPPGDAFVEIAANSYANYLLDDRMRAEEFGAIADLLQRAHVVRATPHSDPRRIGELVQLIAAAVRV
ncbi:MAG TPA: hypothetical protein VGI97_03520 [Gemmatimonadaceae bacterium]